MELHNIQSNIKYRKQNNLLLPDAPNHPIWNGYQLYYYKNSNTGYSRLPVDYHLSFIIGNTKTSEVPDIPGISLNEIALRVVRDGVVLYYYGKTSANDMHDNKIIDYADQFYGLLDEGYIYKEPMGGFIDNIVYASHNHAVEKIDDKTYRLWRKYSTEWLVTTFYVNESGQYEQSNEEEDTFLVNPDDIIFHYFDCGLVTPYQATFWNIEEIYSSLRRLRTNIALSKAIIGYTGDDEAQFHNVMQGDRDYINLPSGTQIVELGNTSATTQLLDQLNNLLPLYKQQMRLVDSSDSTNESGIAKKLKMYPELVYHEEKRTQIEEVCIEFGFEVYWEKLEIIPIAEKIEEINLYKLMFDLNIISQDEFLTKSRNLVDL